jgi:hypothetical protein
MAKTISAEKQRKPQTPCPEAMAKIKLSPPPKVLAG